MHQDQKTQANKVSDNTNRGTAYIVYDKVSSAEMAITHMHEAQLDGAVISVSIVLPRKRFSPSPPSRRAPPSGPRGSGPYPSGPAGNGYSRGRLAPDNYGGTSHYRDPNGPLHRHSRSPDGYRSRGRGGGASGGHQRGSVRNPESNRRRSYSRSRSPRRSRSRSRSRSYTSSRSPPPRRAAAGSNGGGSHRRRESPPPARGSALPRRRSPSYDSYSDSRSRSRSRDRGGRRR